MGGRVCSRCGGKMEPGQALGQTLVGGGLDFPGDNAPVTLHAGGPGKMIDCLKCEDCGWSITPPVSDAVTDELDRLRKVVELLLASPGENDYRPLRERRPTYFGFTWEQVLAGEADGNLGVGGGKIQNAP